ncbi:HTH_48 domain-containing protein [Trichonephila clavipes]|nr:HTH_48 domain-containing protein [Trichonephila clavipes]
MDKMEYRASIKYLFLRGNTPTQIKDELDFSAPSFTTLKIWGVEFKRGRKSLGDDKHSGRPNTATTEENIAKIPQMVLDDRRIKVREIAEVMNMSKENSLPICHLLLYLEVM